MTPIFIVMKRSLLHHWQWRKTPTNLLKKTMKRHFYNNLQLSTYETTDEQAWLTKTIVVGAAYSSVAEESTRAANSGVSDVPVLLLLHMRLLVADEFVADESSKAAPSASVSAFVGAASLVDMASSGSFLGF